MDEETAEGSSLSHMETFLERGILRNKKTFSAVFDRIFLKYEREFPEDETGGKLLDFLAEDCEEQIKTIFGNDDLGSRYQPIVIEDNGDSDIDSEDATLSALLHERVVKVKQEIDWDLEEQKLLQKRREKELMLKEGYSSSDDESDSAVYPGVRWHRRKGRGRWACPVPNSLTSIGTRSDPKNHVQEEGGDPMQLVVIDPSSQIVTTIALQMGLESEDNPNDQDETIFYSQHDNSVALYPDQSQSLSQSILDYTDMCTTDSEATDSAVSGVPLDMPVRSHRQSQNNWSALHRTDARNEVVLAGSPPTCDNNHRYRKKSEFLSSVNSEAEVDRSSKPSVYIPTLDVHIPDYHDPTHTSPDNMAANLQSCDPGPSNRHQHSPTGVKPFNVVDVIKIESQSSTEQDEILSGTASEAEDPRHFSTRQPISRGHSSSAVVREARLDGNSEATGTSQSESDSESESETHPRPSRARLAGDDEMGEELLLSGYESGYVETGTRTSTRLSTIASSRSPSLSSTPPPSDDVMTPPPGGDVMTPPSSPERREKNAATSTLSAVKLKPLQLSLTPVCICPRRESLSELLTCTSANPPLPPSHTPLSKIHMAEGVQDKDVSKVVSTEVVQDYDGASLNPNPSMSSPAPTTSDATTREENIPRLKPNDTTAKDRDTPQQCPTTSSAHLVPSTEPLPSNHSRNETSELETAQDNPSKIEREDAMAGCTTCYPPWQLTESDVCAHCPATGCSLLCLSPPCSCLHTCTYNHHNMHSQRMSQEGAQNSSDHTSSPPNGKNDSIDVTCSTTGGSYGDSGHTLPTGCSNSSEANPFSASPPSPSIEPDHSGNDTHSTSSCCTRTHVSKSNTNCCSLLTSPGHTSYVLPSSSSTQEESYTHPTSPCSSHHTLTTPHSYTNHSNPCPCCSTVQQSPPPHCNNGLSSRLFAMPTPQPMLPLNSLKRSRKDNEELSSNSSENEISSPPTKRHCL